MSTREFKPSRKVEIEKALGSIPRFWERVDKNGPIPSHRPDLGRCWIWIGGRSIYGYGKWVFANGVDFKGTIKPHRLTYLIFKGPIPKKLEPDHLCRIRLCVNPDHLEVVSRRENVLRGMSPAALAARRTHCHKGHPYTKENTKWYGNTRHCWACTSIRGLAALAAGKGETK